MSEFEKYCKDWWGTTNVKLVRDLRVLEPDETKLLKILRVINNTCSYCHDGDEKCVCWRDE